MENSNPYAPPAANVDADPDADADIEAIDVSETWKKRFRAIRAAGGPGLPNWKNMPRKERWAARPFNILAFLFGPFFYLSKFMWRKALALFLACFIALLVLQFALVLMGLGGFAKAAGLVPAVVYSVRANIDYYKKMVLGDNGWW